MFQRLFNPSLSNSFFLFGARGTGKTSSLGTLFEREPHFAVDLLDDGTARRYQKSPALLKADFEAFQKTNTCKWIVLDEVQRVPGLLNVAHQMIEKSKVKFALTGSSARKLKRGGANLLAGRAFVHNLFPLTHVEVGDAFKLDDALNYGSLPKVFELGAATDKRRYLQSYVLTFVREEVIAEQLVRNLEPFRNFLEISAQMSSKVINHLKIAKEVGADSKTVVKYFDILTETWMGFRLPAYHRSIRKAQSLAPKFYWFDLGVRKALEASLESKAIPGTSYYGECFEEFVVNEIARLNHYSEMAYRMSYVSTHNSDAEIDVVLERNRGKEIILIEIKSSSTIDEVEVGKMSRMRKDFPQCEAYYLSQSGDSAMIEGVRCVHWQQGLKEVFGKRLALSSV